MAVAATATRVPGERREMPAWLGGIVGLLLILALWSVLSTTLFDRGSGIPRPWNVIRTMREDGFDFFRRNAWTTLWEAARGYAFGNALALGLALLVLLVPLLEAPIMQLAVTSYCLPLLAVGPILKLFLTGNRPIIVLAAISVFYTSLVGMLLGLRAVEQTSLDLVHAYGGGRWTQLVMVRLINAIPSALAALKVAGPAAILGAILGEFLGGVDSGLGPAMTASQANINIERTWALALVAGLLSGLAYGAIALIARVATPWAPKPGGAST
ncbi:MAG: transporter permease [Jatrophihabitantaceae bacterium]|nr:transporter permease [Jatrophihabitantaceae bacterium]